MSPVETVAVARRNLPPGVELYFLALGTRREAARWRVACGVPRRQYGRLDNPRGLTAVRSLCRTGVVVVQMNSFHSSPHHTSLLLGLDMILAAATPWLRFEDCSRRYMW